MVDCQTVWRLHMCHTQKPPQTASESNISTRTGNCEMGFHGRAAALDATGFWISGNVICRVMLIYIEHYHKAIQEYKQAINVKKTSKRNIWIKDKCH